MSSLYITNELKTKNWKFKYEYKNSYLLFLSIGFQDEKLPVKFDNLKFKYTILLDEIKEKECFFPPQNIKYIESDQLYILTGETFVTRPEKTYNINVWMTNKNKESSFDFSIFVPRPDRPTNREGIVFNSWYWKNEKWNSPIEYPKDGETYLWDEENLKWEIKEILISRFYQKQLNFSLNTN